MKELKQDIVLWLAIVLLVLIGILYVKNADAEDWVTSYYSETVDYVFAYGKPMAEFSKYSCNNNKLIRGRSMVYDYTGTPVKCTIKTMTRKEYEAHDSI